MAETATLDLIEPAHDPSVDEHPRHKNGRRLSRQQEQQILLLSDGSRSQRDIAEIVGCTQPAVSMVLARWGDTRALAAKRLNNGALQLSERIVRKARPDVAVDVLERLGVVAPRKSNTQGSITVVFGDVTMSQVGPQLVDTTEPSYVSPSVIDVTLSQAEDK